MGRFFQRPNFCGKLFDKSGFVEQSAKCKTQNAKRRNCVAIIIKPI